MQLVEKANGAKGRTQPLYTVGLISKTHELLALESLSHTQKMLSEFQVFAMNESSVFFSSSVSRSTLTFSTSW
jgi:hypothetical protein